jgi:hypothetical protein
MRPRTVAAFLAELERRLAAEPARRGRILAEIAEHLDDLVAEATAAGADRATAEARAVERFGPPRRLARGLGERRRGLPRASRIAVALAALATSAGFAYAQLRPTAPVVALSVTPSAHPAVHATSAVAVLGRSQLVALDPVTLRVVKRGPVVSTGRNAVYEWLPPDEAFTPAQGSGVAIVNDAALDIYDLADLHLARSIPLGVHPLAGPTRPSQKDGYADVIRTGAWLGDRIVALVQHQAPPYASRVTRREVVVVDPSSGRVLNRRRVVFQGRIVASARSGSYVATLACHAGRATVLGIAADGRSAVIDVSLPCPAGPPGIALAIRDSVLALVMAGQPLVRIDLATGALRRIPLRGGVAWSALKRPQLSAVWWNGRLIVTGAGLMPPFDGTAPRWPPAGVTAIDPSSGRASIWNRTASWVVPSPDGLSAGGPDIGLTGFSPDGRRLWHVDGTRTVWPYAVGDRVFAPRSVKRHTIVDSFLIESGRKVGSRFQTGNGMRPFSGVTQPIG